MTKIHRYFGTNIPRKPRAKKTEAQRLAEKAKRDKWVDAFDLAWAIHHASALVYDAPTKEYAFHPERKWRFDRAFVPEMIAIEINGGLYVQGRHNRGAALEDDYDKLNTAVLLGWRVIQLGPSHLKPARVNDTMKLVADVLLSRGLK